MAYWLIPSRHYDIEQYPAVKNFLLSFAKADLLNANLNWIVEDYLSEFCLQKLSQNGLFVEIEGKRITIGRNKRKPVKEQITNGLRHKIALHIGKNL